MEAAELPLWLQALEPLSVPFVILLMLAGWLLDRRRLRERRDAADARIAGLAFVVRRTLAKSLEDSWFEGDGQTQKNRAHDLRGGLVEHEPRVEDMLAEAAGASREVAEQVRACSRLYWRAADGIGDAADSRLRILGTDSYGDPTGYELADDVLEGFQRAKSTAEDCVEILRRLDAPIRDAEG